jgi:hypothetical protein
MKRRMKNKNFLLPVSRYAILDIRKGKAIEAVLSDVWVIPFISFCFAKQI